MEDPIVIISLGSILNTPFTYVIYTSLQITYDKSIFDFEIKKADEAIKGLFLGIQNEGANYY